VKRFIVGLLLALAIAGCGTATGNATDNAPATTSQREAAQIAHWRQVTKEMSCKELDQQERVWLRYDDNTIPLVAIHDQQAKKHCPQ